MNIIVNGAFAQAGAEADMTERMPGYRLGMPLDLRRSARARRRRHASTALGIAIFLAAGPAAWFGCTGAATLLYGSDAPVPLDRKVLLTPDGPVILGPGGPIEAPPTDDDTDTLPWRGDRRSI